MSLIQRILSEKRPWVLAVAAALLLNAAAWAVVSPLRAAVDGSARRVTALDDQLREARAAEQRARETLESEVRATGDLERFTGHVLPDSQAAARRLLHVRLTELAEEYDLSFDRQSLAQTTERDHELTRLDVSTVLVGDYGSVRRFVHAIESGDAFLVISELGLSQPRGVDRLVELAIRVSTYYREHDAG